MWETASFFQPFWNSLSLSLSIYLYIYIYNHGILIHEAFINETIIKK